MIKIQLHSLDSLFEIEIKKHTDFFQLIAIRSKSDFYPDNGKVWKGQTKDATQIGEIEALVIECFDSPTHSETITINDGLQVNFICVIDERKIEFSLSDFIPESNESLLMKKLFSFVNELVGDEALEHYLSGFFED